MTRAIREIKVKKVDKVYPCSIDLSGILLGVPHIFAIPQSGIIEGICFFLYTRDTSVKNIPVDISIADGIGANGITHTQTIKVGLTKVPGVIGVSAGKVMAFKTSADILQDSSLSVTYNLRVKG